MSDLCRRTDSARGIDIEDLFVGTRNIVGSQSKSSAEGQDVRTVVQRHLYDIGFDYRLQIDLFQMFTFGKSMDDPLGARITVVKIDADGFQTRVPVDKGDQGGNDKLVISKGFPVPEPSHPLVVVCTRGSENRCIWGASSDADMSQVNSLVSQAGQRMDVGARDGMDQMRVLVNHPASIPRVIVTAGKIVVLGRSLGAIGFPLEFVGVEVKVVDGDGVVEEWGEDIEPFATDADAVRKVVLVEVLADERD